MTIAAERSLVLLRWKWRAQKFRQVIAAVIAGSVDDTNPDLANVQQGRRRLNHPLPSVTRIKPLVLGLKIPLGHPERRVPLDLRLRHQALRQHCGARELFAPDDALEALVLQ